MELDVFGMTDVGCRREKNEDSFLINTKSNLYIVADGMGGHLGGEIASKLAVSVVEEVINELMVDPDVTLQAEVEVKPGDYLGYLRYAIGVASNKIFEKSSHDPTLHGMGTTIVATLFNNGIMYYAHVGDSRIYMCRDGKLKQLTEDHSLVSEQLRAGIIQLTDIRNHKFRNVITRSVGFQESVDIDVNSIRVRKGDKIALCSDGLTNMVQNEELEVIVAGETPRDACYKLIELANDHGGDDNITVTVIGVENGEGGSVLDEETEGI